MKISELIKILEKKKAKEGDLEVHCTTMGVSYLAEDEPLTKDLIKIRGKGDDKDLHIG